MYVCTCSFTQFWTLCVISFNKILARNLQWLEWVWFRTINMNKLEPSLRPSFKNFTWKITLIWSRTHRIWGWSFPLPHLDIYTCPHEQIIEAWPNLLWQSPNWELCLVRFPTININKICTISWSTLNTSPWSNRWQKITTLRARPKSLWQSLC